MYSRFIIVFCIFILAGCISTEPGILPTATAIPFCGDWQASNELFTCIPTDEGLLIQSSIEQMTMRAYEVSIVIYGTIFVSRDDALRISVLEGDAIIGARGQNRIVSAGREVTLNIMNNRGESLSNVHYIDTLPDNLLLEELPRSLNVATFIIEATELPTFIPTAQRSCPAPDTWTVLYSIESGDTLAGIANRYDLTIEELAEGNCMRNISRIIVGQELRVPIISRVEATTIPISVGFRADSYSVEPGTCTILRWDAFDAQVIFLDDEPVSGSTSQEICPEITTTYNLRVALSDTREETRELTISVQE